MRDQELELGWDTTLISLEFGDFILFSGAIKGAIILFIYIVLNYVLLMATETFITRSQVY